MARKNFAKTCYFTNRWKRKVVNKTTCAMPSVSPTVST